MTESIDPEHTLCAVQAFADEQSAMLADLPSMDDGNFTQTEAGQAADAALESIDTEEGGFLLCAPLPMLLVCLVRVIHAGSVSHIAESQT